jgi:Flp pilus assembly pilin Flp
MAIELTYAEDRQEGQTMAEYTVVLGVITIAIVVALAAFSGAAQAAIERAAALVERVA